MLLEQDGRMKYLVLLSLFLIGCTNINELRDEDYTQGCVSSEVITRLGYLGQNGELEVCKAKCSETLPENYCWEYENPRTGCKAKVGCNKE